MNLELSDDAGFLFLDALPTGEGESVAEVTEVIETSNLPKLCSVYLEQNTQCINPRTKCHFVTQE